MDFKKIISPQRTNEIKRENAPFIKNLKAQLQAHPTNIDDEEALNFLIYGMKCRRVIKAKTYDYFIYNLGGVSTLSCANLSNSKIEELNLSKLKDITFDTKTENLKKANYIIKDNRTINFLIDQIVYDFVFPSPNDMSIFIKGILNLNNLKGIEFGEDKHSKQFSKLRELWRKYDRDFNGKLEKKEFKKFVKEIGRKIEYKTFFTILDRNNDGSIDYDEFIKYFENFTNGEEYKDIYEKYQDTNGVILPEGLQRFYKEIQKEEIYLIDACQIILFFNEKIDKEEKETIKKELDKLNNPFLQPSLPDNIAQNLTMSLPEFKIFLHSSINSVYNSKKINTPLDGNRPMNDYFINSSHNTYLTGHQLTSDSSIDMYRTAMAEGYRLVELDCYNDKNDQIKITHGYTAAGVVHLKDVLTTLRSTAFSVSDFPVILSIENHLDDAHQTVMANDFKNILKDLYIFPRDNPPDYLPPLNEMKNKFLIKCGGTKVKKDRTKIKPRSTINYEKKIKSRLSLFQYGKILNIPKEINEDDEEDAVQEKIKNNVFSALLNKKKMNNDNKNDEDNKEKEEVVDNKKEQKIKTKNSETGSDLVKVLGLIGAKFKKDQIEENNHQPWEMVTLKCTKVVKFCEDYNTRKTIIDFNQNSLMKAYPQNFDSTNYDIVKSMIVGCHVSAMNIQATEDDYLLINKVFFLQNKNAGFVLKPKKLLPENTFYEEYFQQYGTLSIDLITVDNIMRLVERANMKINQNFKIKLYCQFIGSFEDDKENKKYSFTLEGNYLKPTFKDKELIRFKVYEKDLAVVLFKLTYNDVTVARAVVPLGMMNEGIRKVPLYDNTCTEAKISGIIAQFNKNF